MAEFLRFQLDVSPLDSTSYGLDGDFAFTEEGAGTASFVLTATATATRTTFATADASASLTAQATATIINPDSATALFGGLTATAAATRTVLATATSDLGGLLANANVLPPPAPSTDALTGSVQFIQPNIFVPKEEVQKPVNVVTGNALSFNVFNASATSMIEFSILEEDNELLLLM
jgi:hypothetical protein